MCIMCPIPPWLILSTVGRLIKIMRIAAEFNEKISAWTNRFGSILSCRNFSEIRRPTKMIANITTKSMVDTIVNAFRTSLTPLFYSSGKDPNGNEGYYICTCHRIMHKSTRSYTRYLSNAANSVAGYIQFNQLI